MQKFKKFLDYAATYPDSIISYHISGMVISGHRNSSYLLELKWIRISGDHFFVSNDAVEPPNNGAIITITQIIKCQRKQKYATYS